MDLTRNFGIVTGPGLCYDEKRKPLFPWGKFFLSCLIMVDFLLVLVYND
jgi:hypothetical protein